MALRPRKPGNGDFFQSQLECQKERFNKVKSELPDTGFVEVYLKVLSYFKPKMKAMEKSSHDCDKIEVVYFSESSMNSKIDSGINVDFKSKE